MHREGVDLEELARRDLARRQDPAILRAAVLLLAVGVVAASRGVFGAGEPVLGDQRDQRQLGDQSAGKPPIRVGGRLSQHIPEVRDVALQKA